MLILEEAYNEHVMESVKITKTGQSGKASLPYLNAYGAITKVLEKIIRASTPDRFTQDFLATKLGMKGGSVKALIPFLKRTGFLNSDGTPTDLYNQFRNESLRKVAAAQATRTGYAPLYEISEYIHDASASDLKGTIVQVTGLDSKSSTVKGIIGSFKALTNFADFEAKKPKTPQKESDSISMSDKGERQPVDIKLGYTINLNLPATSDVAVFNAIFKSLRDNLLDR